MSPVSALQEYLQKQAPSRGCRAEELWDCDYSSLEGPRYKACIVLLNTLDGAPTLPWSWWHPSKQKAKAEAATLALGVLQEHTARIHSNTKPHVVHMQTRARGGGSSGSTMQIVQHAELVRLIKKCDWYPSFAKFKPVFEQARLVQPHYSASGALAADDGYEEIDIDEEYESAGSVFSYGDESEFLRSEGDAELDSRGDGSDGSEAPSDTLQLSQSSNEIGKLGEQWIFLWLKSASVFVKPESVKWRNQDSESGANHDIECELAHEKGVCEIEVKTRLSKPCGHATTMSPKQLARMRGNSRYILIVVGKFRNVLEGYAPEVRVLRNCTDVVVTGILPRGLAGLFIGRYGAIIRKFSRETLTKMRVVNSANEEDTGSSVTVDVRIRGSTPDAVQDGRKLLYRWVEKKSRGHTHDAFVSPWI